MMTPDTALIDARSAQSGAVAAGVVPGDIRVDARTARLVPSSAGRLHYVPHAIVLMLLSLATEGCNFSDPNSPIVHTIDADHARHLSPALAKTLDDIALSNPGFKVSTVTAYSSPDQSVTYLLFDLQNIQNSGAPHRLMVGLDMGRDPANNPINLTGPVRVVTMPDKDGNVHMKFVLAPVQGSGRAAELWNTQAGDPMRPIIDAVFKADLPMDFRPPAGLSTAQLVAWVIQKSQQDPAFVSALQSSLKLDNLVGMGLQNAFTGVRKNFTVKADGSNRVNFASIFDVPVASAAGLPTPIAEAPTPVAQPTAVITGLGTITNSVTLVARTPTPDASVVPPASTIDATPGQTTPEAIAHDFTFAQAALDSKLAPQYYADVQESENPDQDFKGRVFNLSWTGKDGKPYTTQIVLGQKAYAELTNNGTVVPTDEQVLAYITPDKIAAVQRDLEFGKKDALVIIYGRGTGYLFASNFTYYAGNGAEPGVKILGADNATNPYKLLKDLGVARFMWSDEAAAQFASGLAATDGSSIIGVQGADGKYKQLEFPWSLSPLLRADQRQVDTMWNDPSFTIEQKQALMDRWLDGVIGKGFTDAQVAALKDQLNRLIALPASVPLQPTYTDGSGLAFKPYSYGGLVMGGTPQGNEIFSMLLRIKQIDNIPGLRSPDPNGVNISAGSLADLSRKAVEVNSTYKFWGGSNPAMNMLMTILWESRNIHLYSLGSDHASTMPIASKSLGIFTDRSNGGYLMSVVDAAVQLKLMSRSEVSYGQFQTYFNQARPKQP